MCSCTAVLNTVKVWVGILVTGYQNTAKLHGFLLLVSKSSILLFLLHFIHFANISSS